MSNREGQISVVIWDSHTDLTIHIEPRFRELQLTLNSSEEEAEQKITSQGSQLFPSSHFGGILQKKR